MLKTIGARFLNLQFKKYNFYSEKYNLSFLLDPPPCLNEFFPIRKRGFFQVSEFSISYLRRKFNSGLNRFSRKFILQRVFGIPYELQLVPTNACNLKCRACPKTVYETDNRHLHPDIYDKVKREIFPHIRILNMQGLGEPMLSPLFPKMIEDAMKHKLKIRFVTNATRMESRIMKKIFNAGADVTISLDGAVAQTHENARPGSDFDLVLKACETFHSLKRENSQNDFHLHINTVVTTRNVQELEDILDIGIEYGVSSFQLINPGMGERDDEYARDVIVRHPELLRKKMPALIRKSEQHGIFLQYPDFAAPHDPEQKRNQEQSPGNDSIGEKIFPGVCMDPWRLVYIDVDGWVRPCCRAIWIGMGNIMERPFREIWNNEHYRKLRGCINTDNPPDFCRTCTLPWGITLGNERFPEELEKRGVTLPPAPVIGVKDPRKEQES